MPDPVHSPGRQYIYNNTQDTTTPLHQARSRDMKEGDGAGALPHWAACCLDMDGSANDVTYVSSQGGESTQRLFIGGKGQPRSDGWLVEPVYL